MGTVFISYRRDDSGGSAGRIYDRLAGRLGPERVVMDVDSMKLGMDFVDQINKFVSACDVMLAIIGPSWEGRGPSGQRRIDSDTDYVRLELEAALARGIPVIPLLVQEAEMPRSEDLPTSLRPLVRRHGEKLRHERFHADVENLVEGVEALLAQAPESDQSQRAPAFARPLPQAGEQFAGLQIETVIGSGASGLVYRATELRPTRSVALKVLVPRGADGDQLARMRDQFFRECEIASTLEHPHVIPVHQFGEEEGLLFIAMRYVPDGYNLAHLLLSGPLEPRLAAELALQIASALDAAHARELVHCDLKPGNVLIARDGPREHTYLTDFGVASTAGASVEVARGTLDYCAPEQFRAEPLDARTDIYSLGCMIYEMLAGATPFARASREATLLAHVSGERPVLTGSLPEAVNTVLLKAIAANPDERQRSAGALGAELADAIGVSVPTATPTPPTSPTTDERSGRPWLPQIGDTFADYKLEAELGSDDLTEIFRGRHVDSGRTATVKIMHPLLAAHSDMRDRFARQQRLMARIEHPGIVPVYSLGEVEGLPYVAMRHIDAPTLDELLKREGRLAPKRAAGLIMQVATTLDALHDAGILHRNVKPGSIIVEGSQPVEHAYLTDTGLAHHEGMEMLTPSENFLDNVDYLAPEIALSREVGPPADVYALGCVLFELVTGISPMRRENQMMTMRAHTAEPPPSVLDVSPRLPAELDIVLRKSMAKEPGERYPSPSAFGAAAAAATASS